MSQSELGEKLGVTFQQVQKYERGTNRLGASRLFLAGKVLGVPVSYFFEGLETNDDVTGKVESPVYDFIASPDGLDLAQAFAAVKDRAIRRRVIDLLKSLATPVAKRATVTDAEVKSLLSTRATDGRGQGSCVRGRLQILHPWRRA